MLNMIPETQSTCGLWASRHLSAEAIASTSLYQLGPAFFDGGMLSLSHGKSSMLQQCANAFRLQQLA